MIKLLKYTFVFIFIMIFSPMEVFALEQITDTENVLYTYESMMEDIQMLEERYPGRIACRYVGQSLQGRQIAEVTLGNPEAPVHVMVQGSIHAREYMNAQLLMRMLEYYAENYDLGIFQGKTYRQLFENTAFHVIPMANPDGVAMSQAGTVSGDLNLSLWKANAAGVDLNKNFDADWEGIKGSPVPAPQDYKGPSANSEPETQALVRVAQERNYFCYLSYHSKGEVIYHDVKGNTPENSLRSISLANYVAGLTGYRPVNTIGAPVSMGGFNDWVQQKLGKPGLTIETGRKKCPLPISEFPIIWEKNKDTFAAIAFMAL